MWTQLQRFAPTATAGCCVSVPQVERRDKRCLAAITAAMPASMVARIIGAAFKHKQSSVSLAALYEALSHEMSVHQNFVIEALTP